MKLLDRYDVATCRIECDGEQSEVLATLVPADRAGWFDSQFPVESPFILFSVNGVGLFRKTSRVED